MKKVSILILIAAFLTFLGYETFKSTSYDVLEIISPTQIAVDVNGNGTKDEGETIELNIQSFSTKPSDKQAALAKKLKITEEDALGLGFLADSFVKETLLEKQVKLKTNPNKSTKIYIDNKDYELLLLNSGLAVGPDGKITPQLSKNIEKVHKLNLKIFNNKSHKYHKLNCKYGLMAHNSQILPQGQLPKDAKPCKFCFGNHKKHKHHKYYKKGHKYWNYDDEIPNIPQAPTVLNENGINVFLTDLTRTLKPSNNCNTPVCRALLAQVNSANSSIDFAIYGYTKIPALQTALENAQRRGVKIRFVYDIDGKNENLYPDTLYLTKVLTNNQADFATRRKGGKNAQSAIMHNKFFIFDNKTVLTGSANISNTDMSGFNSNAIILINSPQIAEIYEKEFEQMCSGRFHKQKTKIKNKENISLGDSNAGNSVFSIYFSPKDSIINSEIVPLIDNSKKYIYMPVFLITHKQLAESLIRAKKRGVDVKVILDATNAHTPASKHKLLRENGIAVKTENFAGKLHSKSIIIDDTYTIIGSMNFSRSGEGINDENLLIIKNRGIAVFYKNFFQYLWNRIPKYWLTHNARAESPDSIGSCSDGIDNDFDGKIDRADDSCKIVSHKKTKHAAAKL